MTAGIRVLVRGAGDLATGIAHRMYRAGFEVVMTELPEPLAERRTVAFAECVFRGRWCVEGVWAARVDTAEEALRLMGAEPGVIPVIADPEGRSRRVLEPAVLVDARMAKRNLGTTREDAPLVVGLGPGFTAGEDVHAVVETARGHCLGRVIYRGRAHEHTGVPGDVGGFTHERVLRAPAAGIFLTLVELGDRVEMGQVVAEVVPAAASPGEQGAVPVRAAIAAVVRLLRDGAPVRAGQKVGDVDPRMDPSAVWYISDKSRPVAGGVLETVSCLLWGRPPVRGSLAVENSRPCSGDVGHMGVAEFAVARSADRRGGGDAAGLRSHGGRARSAQGRRPVAGARGHGGRPGGAAPHREVSPAGVRAGAG